MIFLMAVILFTGAWYDGKRQDSNWHTYAVAHSCRSIGFAGAGEDYMPSHVVYQCDTGVREYAK